MAATTAASNGGEYKAPAKATPALATVVAVALVVTAIETALWGALALRLMHWAAFLVLHAAIVAGMIAWIRRIGRAHGEAGPALLMTFLVAATGPIGALASLALLPRTSWQAEEPRLLSDWYGRIANAVETDEVTRLCELVATGRTSDVGGHAPSSFSAIMDRGSLDDRQAALGVIARNFHPDYLPALLLALKNEEPVIRVQAAAVATKIRSELTAMIDRVAALTGDAGEPGTPAAIAAAAQLDAASASGLLDEGDRIRARVLADRLKVMRPASRIPMLSIPPVVHRKAFEVALIANGQFTRLRVGRRIAAVETGRAFRVRRARPSPRARAG